MDDTVLLQNGESIISGAWGDHYQIRRPRAHQSVPQAKALTATDVSDAFAKIKLFSKSATQSSNKLMTG